MRQAIFIAAQRSLLGLISSDPYSAVARSVLFSRPPTRHAAFVRSFVRSFVGASHEIAREVTDDGPETETRRNEPTGREINNAEKGGE